MLSPSDLKEDSGKQKEISSNFSKVVQVVHTPKGQVCLCVLERGASKTWLHGLRV